MLKPYEPINWEQIAKDRNFPSVRQMIVHYVIEFGSFGGVALEFGVDRTSLKNLLRKLRINQFKPKDFFAWSKGYFWMDLLVESKMNEGMSAGKICEFIDHYICIKSIRNTMRRINAKKNLNHTSGNKGHPPRIDHK